MCGAVVGHAKWPPSSVFITIDIISIFFLLLILDLIVLKFSRCLSFVSVCYIISASHSPLRRDGCPRCHPSPTFFYVFLASDFFDFLAWSDEQGGVGMAGDEDNSEASRTISAEGVPGALSVAASAG